MRHQNRGFSHRDACMDTNILTTDKFYILNSALSSQTFTLNCVFHHYITIIYSIYSFVRSITASRYIYDLKQHGVHDVMALNTTHFHNSLCRYFFYFLLITFAPLDLFNCQSTILLFLCNVKINKSYT